MSRLDIIPNMTKVADLRSALKESCSHGRGLLNVGIGRLLLWQRIVLYRLPKKNGNYNKLSVSRLRYYAKQLRIAKCTRMRKQTIISALLNFESNHIKKIGGTAKTHLYDVVPARKKVTKEEAIICAHYITG